MSIADTYPSCNKKMFQNMLTGSLKFMSPVNNVWELSSLNDNLEIFRIWHNCGPLTVHEYCRYVSHLCNKKMFQNMLTGSLKFMSPVNKVWELSSLNDNLEIFRIWHNCGPLIVHEYCRYVSQLCNPKIFRNMLIGSFKFMSPVNNVWKLSTLADLLARMHNLFTHNGH